MGQLDALSRAALRFLLIAAALVVAGLAFDRLRIVVLPVLLAILFSPLLVPVADALQRRGAGRTLAALAATGGAVLVLAAVVAAVAPGFATQVDDLAGSAGDGIEQVQEWLAGRSWAPATELDDLTQRAGRELRENLGQLAGGVLSGVTVALEIAAALLLSVVLAFFFVRDGDAIWSWVVRRWGHDRRAQVDEMGRRAYGALGSYLRGIATVALAEAVMVALALSLLGVPLALPLAVLTFVGAFIPVVGAVLVGGLAMLVALVAGGLTTALLVGAVYVVIQQVESNVLHPVVVGRAVEIHPVALLLAVTTGGVLAGIVGALIAGPLLAAAHAAMPDQPSATSATSTTSA